MNPRLRTTVPLLLASLAALLFVEGSVVLSFPVIASTLGVDSTGTGYQRDVRVFENSTDATAHDNLVPDPEFPGALGSAMAVWKSTAAWNSDLPHGQNFDYDWQGSASSPGSVNENTVHWGQGGACGGSVISYTTFPIHDGWSMTLCDQWVWSDGPGSPGPGQIDIQGLVTHELGHALGLGHVTGPCGGSCLSAPTMCPFTCGDSTEARTIEAQDGAALGTLYGAKPANKPVITGLDGSLMHGFSLLIEGKNFPPTVDVKFSAGTSKDTWAQPGVVPWVSSLAGGTRIVVIVPPTAIAGNVLIWDRSLKLLSNPYPTAIGQACVAAPSSSTYGAGKPGTNGIPRLLSAAPPSLGQVTGLTIQNGLPGAVPVLFHGFLAASVPFDGGTLLVLPKQMLALPPLDSAGSLTVNALLPNSPNVCGMELFFQAMFQDPGAGGFYNTAQTAGMLWTLGS